MISWPIIDGSEFWAAEIAEKNRNNVAKNWSRFSNLGEGIFRDVFDLKNA